MIKNKTSNQDRINSISQVDNRTCTSCGVCAGACPQKCIDFQMDSKGQYLPHIDDKNCINCGICAKVCSCFYSGEREVYNIESEAQKRKIFGGTVKEIYIGLCKDKELREICTSGGLMTQMIAELLATNTYDIAFLVKGHEYYEQKGVKAYYKGEPLEETAKSRYVSISHERSVRYMIENRTQKIIFVGVGCAVRSILNAIEFYNLDKSNYLFLGLRCWMSFRYSIFDYYQCYKKKTIKKFYFRSKDNGSLQPADVKAEYIDGTVQYWPHESWTILKPYICLEHCNYCSEHLNTKADIVYGDNWTKVECDDRFHSGMMVIRSKKGVEALEKCKNLLQVKRLDNNVIEKEYYRWVEESSRRTQYGIRFERDNGLMIYPVQYQFSDSTISEQFYKKIKRRMKYVPDRKKIGILFLWCNLKLRLIHIKRRTRKVLFYARKK